MLLSYTFTPIADTSPDSPYSGLVVGQAINDLGQVAFVAVLKSGGQAIYRTEADGRLTTIAQTDGLIRDFYLSPYMNDSGTVSFGANLTDGRQAVFTGSGEALTRIADTEPASPFSSIPNPAQRMDEDGVVYFRATLTIGPHGLLRGRRRTNRYGLHHRRPVLGISQQLRPPGEWRRRQLPGHADGRTGGRLLW